MDDIEDLPTRPGCPRDHSTQQMQSSSWKRRRPGERCQVSVRRTARWTRWRGPAGEPAAGGRAPMWSPWGHASEMIGLEVPVPYAGEDSRAAPGVGPVRPWCPAHGFADFDGIRLAPRGPVMVFFEVMGDPSIRQHGAETTPDPAVGCVVHCASSHGSTGPASSQGRAATCHVGACARTGCMRRGCR